MEKYRDYRVALGDGYRIFLPNLPQSEYHFTNYWNGFLEGFTFDPARPTSLLYKKTPGGGWELIGAMYTAPRNGHARSVKRAGSSQHGPVARAHQSLLAAARRGSAHGPGKIRPVGIDRDSPSVHGGGRPFFPQIFGWMVHVYPFEPPNQIWAQ